MRRGDCTATVDPLTPNTTYYWRARTAAGAASVTSPIASFTVGPSSIPPPMPVQPLSGAFTHKRPTLTVANVGLGAMPALTYAFDVATDAAFATVLASGSVSEGVGQTSFTPSTDLASGGAFYWRARAVSSSPAVVSVYSPTQSFTTVNPDDGLFRYTLTLHLASAASCNRAGVYPSLPDVAFDSALTVNGDNLHDHVQPEGYLPLDLDLQRAGSQLSSGTLVTAGTIFWPGGVHFGKTIHMTVVSGSVDVTGRLTGTAHGAYSDEGFPGYVECMDSQIVFTLTPHS